MSSAPRLRLRLRRRRLLLAVVALALALVVSSSSALATEEANTANGRARRARSRSVLSYFAAPSCCASCANPYGCCCSPGDKLPIKRTIYKTKSVRATKTLTVTRAGNHLLRARGQAEDEMDLETEMDVHVGALGEDEDDLEAESLDETETGANAERRASAGPRNLCSRCPANVALVHAPSNNGKNNGGAAHPCCPNRKTVTVQKTRSRTFTVYKTHYVSARMRTSTATPQVKVSGQLYIDLNKNGRFDFGLDVPLSNALVSVVISSARRAARAESNPSLTILGSGYTDGNGSWTVDVTKSDMPAPGSPLGIALGSDPSQTIQTVAVSANGTVPSGAFISPPEHYPCTTYQDCPVLVDGCTGSICDNSECVYTPFAANTPSVFREHGTCRKSICNGNGTAVSVTDNSNLPDDGNPCTLDSCKNGVPVYKNSAKGTSCGLDEGDGYVCDGKGACVAPKTSITRTTSKSRTMTLTPSSTSTQMTNSKTLPPVTSSPTQSKSETRQATTTLKAAVSSSTAAKTTTAGFVVSSAQTTALAATTAGSGSTTLANPSSSTTAAAITTPAAVSTSETETPTLTPTTTSETATPGPTTTVDLSNCLNAALDTNGGLANASSVFGSNGGHDDFGMAKWANDGVFYDYNHVYDGYWHDATGNTWPDWWEVVFNSSRTVSRVDLYMLSDHINDANYVYDHNPAETCSSFCLTSFAIQYWNGTDYDTLPGGDQTSNNLVWFTVAGFSVTTDRIRVLSRLAGDSQSRIQEVQAWDCT